MANTSTPAETLALAVMNVLAVRDGVGVSNIAKRVGVTSGRVRRALAGLAAAGQVRQRDGYNNTGACFYTLDPVVNAARHAEEADRKAKQARVRDGLGALGILMSESVSRDDLDIELISREHGFEDLDIDADEREEIIDSELQDLRTEREDINDRKVGYCDVTLTHDQFLALMAKAGLA